MFVIEQPAHRSEYYKSRNDHKALAAWYQKHLGMELESWGGAILREDKAVTAWHLHAKDS